MGQKNIKRPYLSARGEKEIANTIAYTHRPEHLPNILGKNIVEEGPLIRDHTLALKSPLFGKQRKKGLLKQQMAVDLG